MGGLEFSGDRQMGEEPSRGVARVQVIAPHPFWMAARGSRLLRTQIIKSMKKKKNAAVAKHIR